MRLGFVVTITLCSAAPGVANINLELRPASPNASVACGIVNIGLFAVSDSDGDQSLSAAQVIFAWDPEFLQLLGIDDTGAVNLGSSFFPLDDPFGLNEVVPPQDGDGLYLAFAPIGEVVSATPEGTLLTTFRFQPLAVTSQTSVDILETGGRPPTQTKVFDGKVPGLNVLGSVSGSVVAILESPTPDFNNDSEVNAFDLATLLGSWGQCPPAPNLCPADLNCDGEIDATDLAFLLGNWGPIGP